MNRQTARLAQQESMPKKRNTLLQHTAVRPLAEPASVSNGLAAGLARDFTQVPVQPQAQTTGRNTTRSCPMSPQRCPFGGACHSCPPRVQSKLKIGQPGDKYEQEADQVAEQVMRMPEPQVQRKGCSSCKDDEDKILQTKSAGNAGNAQVDHPLIQSVLSSPGQPLDAGTRSFMEPRFGQDFSGVRVHTDGQAAESARAVNALAYTVGRDVVFGAGQYAPGTDEGRRLVAHELVHVGQQNVSLPSPPLKVGNTKSVQMVTTGNNDSIYEKETDQVATAVSHQEQPFGSSTINRNLSDNDARKDGTISRNADENRRPALNQRGSVPPIVQCKRMQVGDLDVDFVPRAVFETAFQAPAGRITANRGILLDDNGHGVAQLARNEEAVGLSLSFAISWQNGRRGRRPPPGIPPELLALCNPCLILESSTMRDVLRFARKTIRDMAKDCRNRETFAERRDFVQTFLEFISGDPCLLIEESPIKVTLPLFGIELGLFQACRAASFIPVVSNILQGISSAINTGFDLLNNLPTEQMCNGVPIIDPPDPDHPSAKGTANVIFNTRFVPDNGLVGFGPSPITNQSGTGATVEQPVASGRQKIGDRGVNVHLAPALLRVGALDRGQDLADVDVLLAVPPVPIDYSCRDRFGPFLINFDRFHDEPGQLEAIHQWFHGLHPRTKQDLANGKGRINIIGRASRTGSFDFNMKLSEKRAKRVEKELRLAAGSDSHLRTSATGFLAAVEEGEAANERRADVEAVGTLEGDAALEVATPEGACIGGSVADTLPSTTDEADKIPTDDFVQYGKLG